MATQPAGRGFLSEGGKPGVVRQPLDSSEDGGATAARASEENRTVCGAASSAAHEKATEAIAQQLSKLNASAQEFRPVADTRGSGLNADAQVFQPSSLSASAPPFFPGGGEPLECSGGADAYSQLFDAEPVNSPEEDDMEVMLRTQETLAELGRAPGRFEELVPALLADIYPLICHKQTLQNLADVIVDFAVSSPNVSYMAAQLCSHLEPFAVDEENFRYCLFRKCSETTKKLADSRTPRRKHFIMFLAEIFLALEIDEGNRTVRCTPLAKGVKRLMLGFLNEPDDDDIKCVVQVLKLCGWELTCHEQTCEHPVKPSVSDVLAAVVERRGRAGQSCQRLIDSVLALQASGWGRSHVSTDAAGLGTSETAQPTEQPFHNEPIFYSPDGREITRREAGFAGAEEDEGQPDGELLGPAAEQEMLHYGLGSGDISDGDTYDEDPALNAEIRAAYEEFCHETSGFRM